MSSASTMLLAYFWVVTQRFGVPSDDLLPKGEFLGMSEAYSASLANFSSLPGADITHLLGNSRAPARVLAPKILTVLGMVSSWSECPGLFRLKVSPAIHNSSRQGKARYHVSERAAENRRWIDTSPYSRHSPAFGN